MANFQEIFIILNNFWLLNRLLASTFARAQMGDQLEAAKAKAEYNKLKSQPMISWPVSAKLLPALEGVAPFVLRLADVLLQNVPNYNQITTTVY